MGKGLRKIKRHVRRGEHYTRDHLGTHTKLLTGAGIKLLNGQEIHY
jgi:hypothetical protein